MNSLREKIKLNYQRLSNTNKVISDSILNDPESNFDLTIANLAKRSYCSTSAIIKYINYFGYKSYKVFQVDLNTLSELKFPSFIQSFQLVEEYIENNAKMVEHFIEQIKSCNKVYLFAAGQSQIPAIDFRSKCNKIEADKFIFETNTMTQDLLLSTVSPNDFVIFISNSGEARELLAFNTKINHQNKVLITNRIHSKLSKSIHHVISFENNYESPATFKEFTCEAKYTLLFFFDKIFAKLYSQHF